MLICYVACSLNQLAQLVTMLSILLSGFSNGSSSVSSTMSHRDRHRLPESLFSLVCGCCLPFLQGQVCWMPPVEVSSRGLVYHSYIVGVQYWLTKGKIGDKGRVTPWPGRIWAHMLGASWTTILPLDAPHPFNQTRRQEEPSHLYQMTLRSPVVSLKHLKEGCQVVDIKFR